MNPAIMVRMVLPFAAACATGILLVPFRRWPGSGDLLRPILVLLAAGNLVLVGFLWTRQVDFPLNLDLMEGSVLQHVQRAAAGEPIYPQPTTEFVALVYNPLYYELGAVVGHFTGVTLPMLRVLSMLAAALSALILFVVVREKTGSVWWGFVASGLFAAANGVMECYLATAHSDGWSLLCALAGTLVLDRMRSRRGSMAGILLLAASFWFKQPALFLIGGLTYLTWRDGMRRAWPCWMLAVLVGPVAYQVIGPSLFGPWFHYFTWQVPRRWGTDLRVRSLLRYLGFISLFYPVLAASSVASVLRRWREPDAWRTQLGFAMLTGLMGALDRGSAENVFIAMGTFLILVGTIGLAEWSRSLGRSPLPAMGLLLAFVTLAYDPRPLTPSPRASAAYEDLIAYLGGLGGPVFGPWQGQLPGGFVLHPAAHWVALEDLVRGPGRDPGSDPEVRRLAAPVLHPPEPAFVIANQPLDSLRVLEFLERNYVLVCDLGDRFRALRVLPKRYDHGWPRYLYRTRTQPVDSAALRRLCATS